MLSRSPCFAGSRRSFGRALTRAGFALAVAIVGLAALPGAWAQDNPKDYPARAVKISCRSPPAAPPT